MSSTPQPSHAELRPGEGRSRLQRIGLLAAPLAAALVYVVLPDGYRDAAGGSHALGHAGRTSAALAVWMAVWWMSEAIPVYATALLPLVVLPLAGVRSIHAAAAPYAHELIFLFMGGFVLALSMQRWRLDRRIALASLSAVGSRPDRIVGGLMATTAVLSMWVSNTATAILMLSIAVSVIGLTGGGNARGDASGPGPGSDAERNFATCALLGIAYAASIGGLGTLVGTPPNLFLASYAGAQLGIEISFVRWMGVGLPLVAVFLPVAWWLLTRVLHPVGREPLAEGAARTREAVARLGPLGPGERVTLAVFVATALAWVTRPLLVRVAWGELRPLAGLTDAGIAVLAALVLFVIPVDRRRGVFAMDWETAVRLPWGVLILFGGGLSLAAALEAHGVGEYLGHRVAGLAGAPSVLLVGGVVALVIFLTELTSNTATTATLIPVLAGIAPGLGLDPLLLIVPAAIAASCAFMLPVATPPNAIVFGSGRVTIGAMCRAGLWLNLIGVVLITALAYAVALPLLAATVRTGG